MKLSIASLATLAFAGTAPGQSCPTCPVIDFESVPGAMECLPISTQFQASHGVTFQFANGAFPVLARVGAPIVAFYTNVTLPVTPGCPTAIPTNGDTPAPGQLEDFGCWFLTDDDCTVGGIPQPLRIDYNPPTFGASGYLFDIDGTEQWTITALDQSSVPIRTIGPIVAGSAGTGDAIGTPWSFDETQPIYRIELTGTNASGSGFGLAFDNFRARGGCADLAPDAVAWWPLDTVVNGSTPDYVQGLSGAFEGPVVAAGLVGDAARFSGGPFNADRIRVPSRPYLDLVVATIEFWVKPVAPGAHVLLEKGLDALAGTGYQVRTDANGRLLLETGAVLLQAPDPALDPSWRVVQGQWNHVAISFAAGQPGFAGELSFFVNGNCYFSGFPGLGESLRNNADLVMGARPTGNAAALNGLLDEVTYYDSALSPAEILEIYCAGPFGKCRSDCDGDGIADSVEILNGSELDVWHVNPDGSTSPGPDGIPDDCQWPVDGAGKVYGPHSAPAPVGSGPGTVAPTLAPPISAHLIRRP